MNTIECDVLIVGGGVAAVSAAVEAQKSGASVCMAVKGTFGALGQRGAGASSCGKTFHGKPKLPGDKKAAYNPDEVRARAIAAGLGLADRKLVDILIEGAGRAHNLLDEWGVYIKMSGSAALGFPIVSAAERVIRSSAIMLLEDTMVVDLLIHDGACCGAVAVREDGEILTVKCPAVVLATGGDARLFKHNVHPPCVTGDGYAMALRAGAELMNLEFLQIFFCTVWPTANLFHVWEAKELGDVRNALGRAFLEDYLPEGVSVAECIDQNLAHAPFSTRDSASRFLGIGIVKEIQAGRGTKHGGIYIDHSMRGSRQAQAQADFLKFKGIDCDRGPLQITMGFQCSNGGLRIDDRGMASVPGVFAAGEVSTGMHGADRIGGHMLAAALVFGTLAGKSAAAWSEKHATASELDAALQPAVGEVERFRRAQGAVALHALLTQLQESAWSNGLLLRSEQSLQAMLEDIREIKGEFQDRLLLKKTHGTAPQNPPGRSSPLISALELRNLLLVGEAFAKAALERKESRGGHYREDFPQCSMGEPPQGHMMKLVEDGKITLAKEIIDPDWTDADERIGEGRWG